jgi:hypothetical protein
MKQSTPPPARLVRYEVTLDPFWEVSGGASVSLIALQENRKGETVEGYHFGSTGIYKQGDAKALRAAVTYSRSRARWQWHRWIQREVLGIPRLFGDPANRHTMPRAAQRFALPNPNDAWQVFTSD